MGLCHHCFARHLVAIERRGILAVNTVSKQLWTSDKRRSFRLDVGRGSKNSSLLKNYHVIKCSDLGHCCCFDNTVGSYYAYVFPLVGLVDKKDKFIPVCAMKAYGDWRYSSTHS
jgi:hypothetical protein